MLISALIQACAFALTPPQAQPQLPLLLSQQQDHFDGTNAKAWLQPYYVNDTFWRGPASDAPVFLCIGGETIIDAATLVNSVHCNMAVEWLQETGALMFALEHRYYSCWRGAHTCPVDKMNVTSDYAYLSSRQAHV